MPVNNTALRIGLAGLGTVGSGVARVLAAQAPLLTLRAGRPLSLVAVSARDPSRKRDVDLSSVAWESDPLALARRDDLDVVVEAIGGANGVAYDLARAVLQSGKSYVTANKALIATHGAELARMAEARGVLLAFEAAVAGGIPVLKLLREGLSANQVTSVSGILNGTCNFILSEMAAKGREYPDVLAEAQALGYAEADPSFDVDGFDSGHKLAILTAMAFGVEPDAERMGVRGISSISAVDIAFAQELGYRVRLLGIARRDLEGRIVQRVEPCLVPLGHSLAGIEGVHNAVLMECDFAGASLIEGRGAGGGPTASAIVADLMDLARGLRGAAFGIPAASLKPARWADPGKLRSRYYLRLTVTDRPGVIAEVSVILKDLAISIESILQRGRDPGAPVALVMVTHETPAADLDAAQARLGLLGCMAAPPFVLRIEEG